MPAAAIPSRGALFPLPPTPSPPFVSPGSHSLQSRSRLSLFLLSGIASRPPSHLRSHPPSHLRSHPPSHLRSYPPGAGRRHSGALRLGRRRRRASHDGAAQPGVSAVRPLCRIAFPTPLAPLQQGATPAAPLSSSQLLSARQASPSSCRSPLEFLQEPAGVPAGARLSSCRSSCRGLLFPCGCGIANGQPVIQCGCIFGILPLFRP